MRSDQRGLLLGATNRLQKRVALSAYSSHSAALYLVNMRFLLMHPGHAPCSNPERRRVSGFGTLRIVQVIGRMIPWQPLAQAPRLRLRLVHLRGSEPQTQERGVRLLASSKPRNAMVAIHERYGTHNPV